MCFNIIWNFGYRKDSHLNFESKHTNKLRWHVCSMQNEQSEEILVIMDKGTHIFMKSNLSVNKYLHVPTIFPGLKTIMKGLYQN